MKRITEQLSDALIELSRRRSDIKAVLSAIYIDAEGTEHKQTESMIRLENAYTAAYGDLSDALEDCLDVVRRIENTAFEHGLQLY